MGTSTAVICDGACTVTLVISPAQDGSPFSLSLADGGLVGGAIVAVWASAWAFKALSKAIGSGDSET